VSPSVLGIESKGGEMEREPLVSVVTPFCNAAPYLVDWRGVLPWTRVEVRGIVLNPGRAFPFALPHAPRHRMRETGPRRTVTGKDRRQT
jgi:hypothetical protein